MGFFVRHPCEEAEKRQLKVDNFVYIWERRAAQLRHFENLTREQIAHFLGLRFAQVKYIFSKVNVRHYIQTQIQPYFLKQQIAELEAKLADPVGAYVDDLLKRSDAETYIWVGPGKRCYYPDNWKRFRATRQFGRILGVRGDQKTLERDLRKAIFKHRDALEARLKFLRSMLADSAHEN